MIMQIFGVQRRGSRWYLSGLIIFIVMGTFITMTGCGEKEKSSAENTVGKGSSVSSNIQSSPGQAEIVRPEVTEKTRATYQWYCSQCHGNKGKGDGVNAKLLTVPPRNHTKADYLESRSDKQLFDAIKQGGLAVGRAPCMPAWGHTLDDNMIQSLVGYIRELCQCESTE